MEDIVAARHIPEDDVGDLVAELSELLRHLLVESPVLVAAEVDLHIRDHDQGLRHLFCRHTIPHGDFQHMLESRFQVRVVRPVLHVDASQLLSQSIALQHLNPGSPGEGHEHVVVSAGVPLREVHRQSDRCRQRPAKHGAGRVRNDQRVGPRFHIIRQLAPLGLQHIIFPDPASVPVHLHHLFDDVVRIQRRGVHCLLTAHRPLHKLAKALLIVPHEGISVDHHRPGRNFRIADLIPTAGGHQCFDNADLSAHRAHQSLELVHRVAQLPRCQNTNLPGVLRRSIRGLDPLCEQRDRVAGLHVHAVLFELLLHSSPHLIFQRRSDQAVHVVVTTVYTDQIQVGTQPLRMVLGHVLQDRAERLSLTKAAAHVSRVERDPCREQRVRLPGLGEKTGDPLLVSRAE